MSDSPALNLLKSLTSRIPAAVAPCTVLKTSLVLPFLLAFKYSNLSKYSSTLSLSSACSGLCVPGRRPTVLLIAGLIKWLYGLVQIPVSGPFNIVIS